MYALRFDRLSSFPRETEPVAVAVPIPRGELRDPSGVAVRSPQSVPYVQSRVTSRWDDGSVRWLLALMLVDLPASSQHTVTLGLDGEPPELPASRVTVGTGERDVLLDTGPLQVSVDPRRGPVGTVRLHGVDLPFVDTGIFAVDARGRRFHTEYEKCEVEEAGPLRASLLFSGAFIGDGEVLMGAFTRVTAWAGKPWVELEHRFVHRSEPEEISVGELGLDIDSRLEGELALGEGYYQTRTVEGRDALSMVIDAETILYQANEHVEECFYGDFWANHRTRDGGVALSIYQAHQNFPKSLRVSQEGIECRLIPEETTIYRGMARTHRIMLHFHGPDLPLKEVSHRSLQFQLPDLPHLDEEVYRDSGIWEEPIYPERRNDRLEFLIGQTADERCKGLGIFAFGDGPDSGYTEQGRGRSEYVWTNMEYDPPHAYYMHYARTSERRFFDIARAAAEHWLDVDICHHSPDPGRRGGHITHSARHVTGGVSMSHQWIGGLLDHYHFTGRVEALEAALGIGGNIMRALEEMGIGRVGEYSPRETGWAMRALLDLYRETHEERYLECCRDMVEAFVRWEEEHGAFVSPYTSHARVRVPFMVEIALNSLMRYYRIVPDDRVRHLIVRMADDLLENCLMRDGLPCYKELPSLQFRSASPHFLETMAYTYELTGDPDYLKAGRRTLEVILDRGRAGGVGRKEIAEGGIVKGYGSMPGPKRFASLFIPFMTYYTACQSTELLDPLDFVR